MAHTASLRLLWKWRSLGNAEGLSCIGLSQYYSTHILITSSSQVPSESDTRHYQLLSVSKNKARIL